MTPGARRLLGEILLERGVITSEELEAVLALQRDRRGRLGRLLVDLGYATEAQICEVVAEQLQIPAVDLVTIDVTKEALALVPKELAARHLCLPWFVKGQELYLLVADPTDVAAIGAVAFATGLAVRPVVAPESEICFALERHYGLPAAFPHAEDADLAQQLGAVLESQGHRQADRSQVDATLLKFVNAVLTDAVRAGASSTSLRPEGEDWRLSYQVDGLEKDVLLIPPQIHPELAAALKGLAHVDSHDASGVHGRTRFVVAGKSYDLQVRTRPGEKGEAVMVRILGQARRDAGLDDLDLSADSLAGFKEMLQRSQGLLLVGGPTGHGKTSTLYGALNFLRAEQRAIATVEDPIEYRLPGITQVAVTERAGLSVTNALRTVLRQGAQVVMFGEIKDPETAQAVFQVTQGGHLVLSKVHSEDAPSALTRLVEMGIPAYVVASAVIGVLGQRLVRRLCECRSANADGSAEPKGCELCRGSGFRGRLAVSEFLRVSPRVRSVLLGGASAEIVRRAARAAGMRSAFLDGSLRVRRGFTTMPELSRFVRPDDDEAGQVGPLSAVPMGLSGAVRRTRRPRVLVVEDESEMRDVLRELLSEEGYDVTTSSNGHEGWEALKRETPDVVVSDIRMPGMDGLELLERIRKNDSTRKIPVLFLTGVGDVDDQVRAYNLGTDDYITKPFQTKLLLSRVRRALFRTQLSQEGA